MFEKKERIPIHCDICMGFCFWKMVMVRFKMAFLVLKLDHGRIKYLPLEVIDSSIHGHYCVGGRKLNYYYNTRKEFIDHMALVENSFVFPTLSSL
jgi:hypothetical protein